MNKDELKEKLGNLKEKVKDAAESIEKPVGKQSSSGSSQHIHEAARDKPVEPKRDHARDIEESDDE